MKLGDLVTVQLAARVWDDQIQNSIASFRRKDYGVIIECDSSRPYYVKIFTSRGKKGWVLKILITDPS